MLDTIKYLIYGNGEWITTLEASNYDIVLFVYTMAAAIAMLVNYGIYIVRTFQSRSKSQSANVYHHKVKITRMMIVSAGIHFLAFVIGWFIPLFYVIGTLFWVNAWLTFMLNKSRLQMTAEEDSFQAMEAQKFLVALKQDINNKEKTSSEHLMSVIGKLENFLKLYDDIKPKGK